MQNAERKQEIRSSFIIHRSSFRNRPESRPAIRALYGINRLFTRIYHNLTILNRPKLPKDGPAIIVCNHISSLDPLLVQSVCSDRLITWMMAREYLALPGLGKVFRILEVIPVERGSRETTPLRTALRQLSAGRILGVFPEGKISTTQELLEFQTGAALMAIKAKVPVFPAYLNGSQRHREMLPAFFIPSKSVISFGSAVEIDRTGTDKEKLESATLAIRQAIERQRINVDDFCNLR